MKRDALIESLADRILRIQSPHPLRVAIDGVDASGKTTLAKALASRLKTTHRQIITASVDDFHLPERIRRAKGSLSPEGFYYDSYDYSALIDNLLAPLGPEGSRLYCTAVFDLPNDKPVIQPPKEAAQDAILLMDGIFLLRQSLLHYWDLTIYIVADFINTVPRGTARDANLYSSAQNALLRYKKRYVPGQKIYHREANPLDKADILIDNNDVEKPEILRLSKGLIIGQNTSSLNQKEAKMEKPTNFPSPFYRWRPHPWHGLTVGPEPPERVFAYIEMTSFDFIKYEVDKETGYLYVDRPQRTSSLTPTLYGFIPRTYCDERVRNLSQNADRGDRDPLDICVVSERPINRSEIFLNAVVVGVLQLLDHGEADDKIIAVLENDHIYGHIREIENLPTVIVERLKHYFRTYKMVEGQEPDIHIIGVSGSEKAKQIVNAAIEDYNDAFGHG